MKRSRTPVYAGLGLLALGLTLGGPVTAEGQSTVKVFVGSQLRPDVLRTLFDQFEKRNPDLKVQIETGGATSDQQNQYLSTVLASRDPNLDVFLVDVIRVAQYAAAGWVAPLDAKLGADKASYLANFLPGPVQADTVNGTLYALPAFTDAQFLYYRKDLLAKYKLAVPRTWDELLREAQVVVKGENNPNLTGFDFQGAPIAGTVCTFLEPFWSAGGNVVQNGKVNVDSPAGRQALTMLTDAVNKYKVTPPSVAAVKTDDSRKAFQAGNVVFGLNWAYAWGWFQELTKGSDPSRVKGLVGVAKLPVFGKNPSSTCLGGWQWVTSNYSRQKDAAWRLIKFMASPEMQGQLAVRAGNLPVRKSLYNNNAVLAANPYFKDLYPVILKARPRPVTAAYSQVEDVMKTNVNAVLAGSKSVDDALKSMQGELEKILK